MPKALKSCPKSNKSPNLVTMMTTTKSPVLYGLYRIFFLKWANPGLFFVYFRLFKQTLQFWQQINVKNVHPVFGAFWLRVSYLNHKTRAPTLYSINFTLHYFFKYFDWLKLLASNQNVWKKWRCKIFTGLAPGSVSFFNWPLYCQLFSCLVKKGDHGWCQNKTRQMRRGRCWPDLKPIS